MTALELLEEIRDQLAEQKDDEFDPFVMGVLAGVEDSVDFAIERIR